MYKNRIENFYNGRKREKDYVCLGLEDQNAD